MDLFLEAPDGTGRFVECKGICGAMRADQWGPRDPCRKPEGHDGRHESRIPRRVFDYVEWTDPAPKVRELGPDDEPRRIVEGP